MPEPAGHEFSGVNLREHPAVRAWGQLRPGRRVPGEVRLLREKKKSAVYRLAGVGPGGSAVVAKQCRPAAARVEHAVYADVLPRLPVSHLAFYGFIEEPGGESCWLFLEELSPVRYLPAVEEHRRLAGRWLGLLHTSAAHLAGAVPLPDRGPGHYRECLCRVRETVLGNLTNPALRPGGVEVLESVAARCDALAGHWGRVEELCAGVPRTLVHGDFIKRNLRVRDGPSGPALVPFDWEVAGWGVPAADLAGAPFSGDPDLAAYWSVVRECWPGADLPTVRRWAALGTVFRFLAAADWAVPDLAAPSVEKPVERLRGYRDALADAVRAVG